MSMSQIISGCMQAMFQLTVPYYNHAAGHVQGTPFPDAIRFLSRGNSIIREQNEQILANQARIMAHLGMED